MASLHKGAELPEDTIINKDGAPSKVPRELYEGGTLMTIGGNGHGHKGSALSMMVDVLGGILSGTGPSFGVDLARRPFFNNGTCVCLLPPKAGGSSSSGGSGGGGGSLTARRRNTYGIIVVYAQVFPMH